MYVRTQEVIIIIGPSTNPKCRMILGRARIPVPFIEFAILRAEQKREALPARLSPYTSENLL